MLQNLDHALINYASLEHGLRLAPQGRGAKESDSESDSKPDEDARLARHSILIVEDTPALVDLYRQYLKREAWNVNSAMTAAEARRAIEAAPPDIVLLDVRLPDENGFGLLQWVKEQGFPTGVIVMTAFGSVNLAVEAIRAGAWDFLVKPFPAERLIVTLKNAIENHQLKGLVDRFKDEYARHEFQGFIGGSLAMQSVYRTIEAAAASKATVFITGESGTGKELCAQAIHRLSPRCDGSFVAMNCAAIPRDLLESEIFGHAKGAFTGATNDHMGAALRADGGTLFLDEIGELDVDLQAKLLRFLQTGQVQRLGDAEPKPVDVRIICASNKDPRRLVEAGLFREDLFYRLYVVPVEMPPLRERGADVISIARHLLGRFAAEEGKTFTGFAADAEDALVRESWPGNIRQLQNVIRSVVVLHEGPLVSLEMLPAAMRRSACPTPMAVTFQTPAPPPLPKAALAAEGPVKPLWVIEKEAIEKAITLCDGNIPRAAALLEVSPSTLYRKRQNWGADPSEG